MRKDLYQYNTRKDLYYFGYIGKVQICNSGALDYIYFVHDASGILLMRLAALEKQRSTVTVTIPLFISPFFH